MSENTNTNNGDAGNGGAGSNQVRFDIRTLYIKDASFESPKSPAVFTEAEFNPEIDVQMNVNHRGLNADDGFHEVVLKLTVTATHDKDTVFLCEIQQAGVFLIQGVGGGDLEKALEIGCPNVLLPFARQAVCDMVVKGGFPQLLVSPVNFEAVFAQRRAQANS